MLPARWIGLSCAVLCCPVPGYPIFPLWCALMCSAVLPEAACLAWYCAVPCFVVHLGYAMLCYAMLCYAMLCYAILRSCATLRFTALCRFWCLAIYLDCWCLRWLLDFWQGLSCAEPSLQSALLEGSTPSPCRTCRSGPCFFLNSACPALTARTSGNNSCVLTTVDAVHFRSAVSGHGIMLCL